MVLANSVPKVNRLIAVGAIWAVFVLACGAAVARAPVLVQAVAENGELTLEGGQRAVLANLVLAEGAADAIRERVLGQALVMQPQSTDRHGRVVAVFSGLDGESVQAHVLREGLAMVYAEDAKAELAELMALEREGVWPLLAADESVPEGFAVVEGVVRDVALFKKQAYVNFGEDWKTDFTIMIPADVMRRMDAAVLENLQGKTVRVRGVVHGYYGPRVTLFHPQMMEVMDATN